VASTGARLSEALDDRGYALNVQKGQVLPAFMGVGVVVNTRALIGQVSSEVLPAVRYLGPYLSAKASIRVEAVLRLKALDSGWMAMHRFLGVVGAEEMSTLRF